MKKTFVTLCMSVATFLCQAQNVLTTGSTTEIPLDQEFTSETIGSTYDFKVTGSGMNRIYSTTTNSMNLHQNIHVSGDGDISTKVRYHAQYQISVSVDGGEFGPALAITTMDLPTTSIESSSCGATVTRDEVIKLNKIIGVNRYIWEVSSGGEVLGDIIKKGRKITLDDIDAKGITVLNGTEYSIRVAPVTGRYIGEYGPACTITSSCPNAVSSIITRPAFNNTVGEATLRWHTIAPEMDYRVRYRISDGPSYTDTWTYADVHDDSTLEIGNVVPGAYYNYEVTSFCGANVASYDGSRKEFLSKFDDGVKELACPNVNNIQVTCDANGTATVTWDYNHPSGSNNETGWILDDPVYDQVTPIFRARLKPVPELGSSWNYRTTSDMSSTSVQYAGLTVGSDYRVQVNAICDDPVAAQYVQKSFTCTAAAARVGSSPSEVLESSTISPNPTQGETTLTLASSMDNATVIIVNMAGVELERYENVSANTPLTIGALLGSGVYNVLITTNTASETLQFVKE